MNNSHALCDIYSNILELIEQDSKFLPIKSIFRFYPIFVRGRKYNYFKFYTNSNSLNGINLDYLFNEIQNNVKYVKNISLYSEYTRITSLNKTVNPDICIIVFCDKNTY